MVNENITGICKWFHKRKGYGFVIGEDGIEYFIHYKNISGEGFKVIEEGQPVVFWKGETIRGPVAVNLKIRDGLTNKAV